MNYEKLIDSAFESAFIKLVDVFMSNLISERDGTAVERFRNGFAILLRAKELVTNEINRK